MALPPLRDLTDHRDVKGGSPRTPSVGVPVAEYQQYVNQSQQPNHVAVWRVLATSGWSLLAGTLLAWFTAWQGKGISMKDLQDYEDKYSPYMQQKETLAMHNQVQDTQIGVLQGIQQRNIEKINSYDGKFHDAERDIIDLQNKVKLFGDYIEGQRLKK